MSRDCPTRPKLLALIKEYDEVPEPSCYGEATSEAMEAIGSEGREELADNNSNVGLGEGQVAEATDCQGEIEGLAGEVLREHRKEQTPTGRVQLKSETSSSEERKELADNNSNSGQGGQIGKDREEMSVDSLQAMENRLLRVVGVLVEQMGKLKGQVKHVEELPSGDDELKGKLLKRLQAEAKRVGKQLEDIRDSLAEIATMKEVLRATEAERRESLESAKGKVPEPTMDEVMSITGQAEVTDNQGKCEGLMGKVPDEHREGQTPTGLVQPESKTRLSTEALLKTPRAGALKEQPGVGITQPRDLVRGPLRDACLVRRDKGKPRDRAQHCAKGRYDHMGMGPKRGGKLWRRRRKARDFGSGPRRRGRRRNRWGRMSRSKPRGRTNVPDGHAEGSSGWAKVWTCGTKRRVAGPAEAIRDNSWMEPWVGRPRHDKRGQGLSIRAEGSGGFKRSLAHCGEWCRSFRKGLEKSRHYEERPRRLRKERESSRLGGG